MRVDNTEVINVLSFCTGYAGIELGLSRVFANPLRCVAVEIEAFAVCNLVVKAEEGRLGIEAVYSDVKTFPAKEFRDCFDIITAGYPCQPFSHAGKRKGAADPRHLWPFIRDSIEQIEPLLVVCENVAGHLSLGFDRVVSDLEDLGYTVEAGIYAAAETGAPHRRERLFIVAYRECDGFSRFLRQAGCRQDRAQQRTDPDGQGARDGANGPALAVAGGVGRRGRDNGEHAGQRRSLQTEGPGELAHAESGRCGQAGAGDTDAANGTAGPGSIMDNPDRRRHGAPEKEVCPGRNGAVDAGQLADTEVGGIQGGGGTGNALVSEDGGETLPLCGCERNRWPARPGQDQYDWEQPRVILSFADYKILKGYVKKYQTRLTDGQVESMAHAEALYAPEPEMGRVAYGFTGRVDELRLLGNGVMPVQFEMALRDLLDQIEREIKTKNYNEV